ncbi:MAG: right-handed parallel beta-helix repeat-containing protein [Bacteroidales bacterium]|nr:right-handed parallel beta-helix repeat-containing protein [Bacteroidales bacterium]
MLFGPGCYHFAQNHLKLYGKSWDGISLTLQGDGSVFTAAGQEVHSGDKLEVAFQPGWHFLSPDGSALPMAGKALRSSGLVRIEDAASRLCRIRSPRPLSLPAGDGRDCYIQLSRWYESRTYPVSKIEDGWIYFTATDLERVSPLGYNVNQDFLYGRMMPRFRLINAGDDPAAVLCRAGRIRLPEGTESAHCCTTTTFLHIHDTQIRSLTLSGLRFQGNADLEGLHLIGIYHCRSERIEIRDCQFSQIGSSVFAAEFTDHLRFVGNRFARCGKHVLSTSATCRDARFLENRFDDCGWDWGPWTCITAAGDAYRISGNQFHNFGYAGIFVGDARPLPDGRQAGGEVEDNVLWYDGDFLAQAGQHTMMDSGAIYVNTANDRAVIRRNYIHDIGGVKDNRGIFCDDGARNFEITGNVILHIANSYAIDARRVSETDDDPFPRNTGNRIEGNLVDAPIRFEGNETSDRCILGANAFLTKEGRSATPALHVRHISRQEKQNTLTTIRDTEWEAIVK